MIIWMATRMVVLISGTPRKKLGRVGGFRWGFPLILGLYLCLLFVFGSSYSLFQYVFCLFNRLSKRTDHWNVL